MADRISLGMQYCLNLIDHLVALILRYALKYRIKVITSNLKAAFAYNSKKELNSDIKDFYFYLAKVLRQTMVRPGKRLLNRRMHLAPCPALDQWLLEGRSVIVTFGHTGNWEWTGSFVGMKYPERVCALYKKIKSPWINRLMYNRRMSHVSHLLEIRQMGDLLRLMKEKSILLLMISDQNPGSAQGCIWTTFLGRNTAFVNGPESLAMRYKLPVVYIYCAPRKDGGYDLSCEEIYNGHEDIEAGIIMQRFAKKLEQNILDYRSQWLWSHKRWKRTAQY